jgi:hypothetical protein
MLEEPDIWIEKPHFLRQKEFGQLVPQIVKIIAYYLRLDKKGFINHADDAIDKNCSDPEA